MGFTFPLRLLSLGFLAILVWLYMRERRTRELEVPSLLLWQSVREETQRSRFPIDWLFLLQAALLAALAIGVAGPYLRSHGLSAADSRIVVVVDASASMQAVERGQRRFDVARRKASEVIAGLDRAAEVMLIAVEAHPRIVVTFTRDRDRVVRALQTLEASDGPGRLGLAIQLARSSGSGGRGSLEVDVFTDLPREELTVPLAAGERLRYFRFGATDDNVAIAALRVTQNPFQNPSEARGYALVKNYSHREKDVALHVTLASRTVLDETLRLGPREGRAVPIRRLGEPGVLEARLDVADALAVDNRALAFVRPLLPIRVLLVTRDAELAVDLRALAEAVPSLRLRQIAAGDLSRSDLDAADLAIFHEFVPEGPLGSNSLFVYPPLENRLFPGSREVVGAQILDWNEYDPILHDLRYVEALPLDRSRMLRVPEWAHVLIGSRAGGVEFPLAFAGEHEGRRLICFSFDLSGRSVRKSENLSLLLMLLNSLRWLVPADPALPVQVDAGGSYRETFAAPATVTIARPNGRTEELAGARELTLEIGHVGSYGIDVGGARRTVHANLFEAEASDIGRKAGPAEETLEGEAATSLEPIEILHAFGRWLLVVGAVVLLVEWLYGQRWRQPDVG